MNFLETLLVGSVVAVSTFLSLVLLGDRAFENLWIAPCLSAVIAIGIVQICGLLSSTFRSKASSKDRDS